jgi:dihydroorotase
MTILIKQACIVDPPSSLNGQITDIFIENGIIKQIGKNLSVSADKEINIEGLHVSPGWMDVFSILQTPVMNLKKRWKRAHKLRLPGAILM